jgi:hypothetical protein
MTCKTLKNIFVLIAVIGLSPVSLSLSLLKLPQNIREGVGLEVVDNVGGDGECGLLGGLDNLGNVGDVVNGLPDPVGGVVDLDGLGLLDNLPLLQNDAGNVGNSKTGNSRNSVKLENGKQVRNFNNRRSFQNVRSIGSHYTKKH